MMNVGSSSSSSNGGVFIRGGTRLAAFFESENHREALYIIIQTTMTAVVLIGGYIWLRICTVRVKRFEKKRPTGVMLYTVFFPLFKLYFYNREIR